MIERGEIRKTRLLIADAHTLVLEGLKRMLEADFDLVGMAENGRDVLRKAEELKPDVVLMDISMPMLNGIDATKQLLKTSPQAKVIFVTMHADSDYVSEAFRAGASGYLLKRSAAVELVRSEEHTSELQSQSNLVCRLLLEKKKEESERD